MSDIQRPIQRHLKGCDINMLNLLENVDAVRKEIGRNISQKRKSEMGQFMTPSTVARFMVSFFSSSNLHTVRLLDAGAGIGSLSGAFLDSSAAGNLASQHVEVVAYEIDDKLRNHLSRTLEEYQGKLNLDVSVLSGDFIEEAVKAADNSSAEQFIRQYACLLHHDSGHCGLWLGRISAG